MQSLKGAMYALSTAVVQPSTALALALWLVVSVLGPCLVLVGRPALKK